MSAPVQKKALVASAVLLVVLAGGAFFLRTRMAGAAGGASSNAPPSDENASSVIVPVIVPNFVPNFTITTTQPAYVEAYYRAEIRARVAGVAKPFYSAIGNMVRKDDNLLQISVPDLDEEVKRKAAIVQQRGREVLVAKKFRDRTRADEQIAAADIDVKNAEFEEAVATRDFRHQEWKRFKDLAESDRAITANIVEERWKFYLAARAAVKAACAAIEKAKAAKSAATAKFEEAEADVKLKEDLVEVAKEDKKLAEKMLEFATLKAPFDGEITARNVDPGTFVQNSTNSPGPALFVIERTELVTVHSNVPDNFASAINDGTEVEIELNDLPGVKIPARVTRRSDSLRTPTHDRTMRVEVDLYNRGPKEYKIFLKQEDKNLKRDKGGREAQPALLWEVIDKIDKEVREKRGETLLLPGMYGTMKFALHPPRDAYLVPRKAVFSKGGNPSLFLVIPDKEEGNKDRQEGNKKTIRGKARRFSVKLLLADPLLAQVWLKEEGRELTAKDLVVVDRQGELRDGQPVTIELRNWK
jgi:multidrug resistance efflux pump